MNGAFVADDGQPLMPTVIAELDGQSRVLWASEAQQDWFRRRFVEAPPLPHRSGRKTGPATGA